MEFHGKGSEEARNDFLSIEAIRRDRRDMTSKHRAQPKVADLQRRNFEHACCFPAA